MELIPVVIRTILFYFVVLIVYRIMGKREVGKLGIIDLIVSILIAELVAISIENYKESILFSLLPIIVLCLLQVILAYISLNVPKARDFLDGKPAVIIKNGKINFKEMSIQKYNLNDLLMQLRINGVRSLDEVEYAILENSGQLSIFRKNFFNLPTSYPFAVIIDGKIQDDVLKSLNKNRTWILNILKKQNIELENVFYAFHKGFKTFIIKKSDLN